MCHTAKKNVQEAVELAKSKWATFLAMRISQIRPHPKEAWKAVSELKDGYTGHHTIPDVMHFLIPDGSLSKTPQEHASILQPHFAQVFNNQKKVDPSALIEVRQRPAAHDIAGPLT